MTSEFDDKEPGFIKASQEGDEIMIYGCNFFRDEGPEVTLWRYDFRTEALWKGNALRLAEQRAQYLQDKYGVEYSWGENWQ